MRQCVDTCTGDKICFMEWVDMGMEYYDTCENFYWWFDENYGNHTNSTNSTVATNSTDYCTEWDQPNDCSSINPELRYCWMIEGFDHCIGEDLCIVQVATGMGSITNMSCTEFWYHMDYLDQYRNITEEMCMTCERMDCEYGSEFLGFCNVNNCRWMCDEPHYETEKCTVDFTY